VSTVILTNAYRIKYHKCKDELGSEELTSNFSLFKKR